MSDEREGTQIEIWARIDKDETGFPKSQDWEDLWGSPIGKGIVSISSVPFFAKNIAIGDIAKTIEADEGFITLESIVQRSGHSTFRIWLHDGCVTRRDEIVADLKKLGAHVEVTLERLLAIDAPPEHEPAIWDYLERGKGEAWGLQVGHSPD
jgi:hypothetical protein